MKQFLTVVLFGYLWSGSAFANSFQNPHYPNPYVTDCGYWLGECENENDIRVHARAYVKGKFTNSFFLNHQGEWFGVRIHWDNVNICKRNVLIWKGLAQGMTHINHNVHFAPESLTTIQRNLPIAGCQPTNLPGNPPPAPDSGGDDID